MRLDTDVKPRWAQGIQVTGAPALAALGIASQRRYMRVMKHLLVSRGAIIRGEPLYIAHDAVFDLSDSVSLGHRCVISRGVRILTHDYSLDRYAERHRLVPADRELRRTAPVEVGDYAFIGMGAMLMPGVSVGDGAIVGARALVTRNVPPGVIVGGVPARVLQGVEEAYRNAMQGGEWRERPRNY